MRQVGFNRDYVKAIKFFEMVGKPIDCLYVKSEEVKNDKLTNGSANYHTFAKLDKPTELFGIWGFGAIDSLLMGNTLKNVEPMPENTPVRLIYKGKKEAKVKIGKKMVDKEIHDLELFDITEEVEKGEITTTVL
jgi:hypothetical protein